MSHRPIFIPTRRRITAGNALLLAMLLASLSLSSYWGHQFAASAELQAAHELGRQAGYGQALDEIGGAVGSAYRTGYQSGQADACLHSLKNEAPL